MYDPKPDVIYRPGSELADIMGRKDMPKKAGSMLETLSLDPSITDVEMRLKEVFIIDNRDPGKGDIYLITIVLDSLQPEPFTIEVKSFEDIHDNEALQLGPAGLTIYRNPEGKIPRYIDYRIMVMESDQEIRGAGDVLNDIRNSDQYKALRDNIVAVATTTQPVAAIATAAADVLVGLIAQILKSNRDDQIIYIAGSFNNKIDDLGVAYGMIVQKNEYARVAYQVFAV